MLPETAYDPKQWWTFFSAETSASASLNGLLFVAISINLNKIVASSQLLARAGKALVTLTGVLFASTICLAPAQSARSTGGQLIGLGFALCVATSWLHWKASHRNPYVTRAQGAVQFALAQCSTLPFLVAGTSLRLAAGGGLIWFLVGAIAAFTAALIDAWVLLIEINR